MSIHTGRAQLVASSVAPRASIRQVHKQATRSRIIDAAKEVFDEQGYEITTIDDIAIRAQVGRSTLYTHFQGKNEIALAISEDLTDKMHISVALLGQTTPGDPTSLANWLSELEEHIRARTTLNNSIFPFPTADTAASVQRLGLTARSTIDQWTAAGWESAIENDVEHLRLLIILCIRWLILYPGLQVPEPTNSREVLIDIVSHEVLRIVKRS
ncbi:MAG: TetR family transcriptional regulator [Actinobacteria bacterium]|uniref:Unannotated protein n=1 Tax=freshwater metagenome TaxID=449393 RepID=A0A6J7GXS7_9ZZZZ|nr:TetR family transcriptional regulator [Actinomycetota bacterium]MTB28244.1 TetR family transcriptional regulator [Actinomycetota bacterium]